MKFITKQYNSKINLVVFGEYDNPESDYLTFLTSNFENINIHIFDWSNLYKQTDYDYKDFVKYFYETLIKHSELLSNSIVIGHGISGTILNQLSQKFECLELILISPIWHTSYINPFMVPKPTFESDINTFYKNLSNLYYDSENIFGLIKSDVFFNRYIYYQKNLEFFENLRNNISLFETLTHIKDYSRKNRENTKLFLGKHDGIVCIKETKKLINSCHFKHKFITTFFNVSAHNLLFEEKEIFNKELNQLIEKHNKK